MGSEHTLYPKESPWKRGREEYFAPQGGYFKIMKNHVTEKFDDRKYVNMDIDINTKRAALKVSPSVVGLVASLGKKTIFMASGTVIESSTDLKGGYLNTIVTSASLIVSYDGETVNLIRCFEDETKIEVHLADESIYEGQIVAYDIHFNIAIVRIHTHAPVPVVTLKPFDDSISIDPREIRRSEDMFHLRPHSDMFNLSPGDLVVAIGRHSDQSTLMVAPGVFSLDSCGFDCDELMMASCRISKSGIGGPLINFYGDIIGFNFYHELFTPFLPVNIVSKCLEHFKIHRNFSRPLIEMEVTNLYAAPINKLEHVIQNFPNIYKGVLVENVISDSHADHSGVLQDDIIVACDSIPVLGVLEFFRMAWDKTGKEPLELLVIRKGSPAFVKINMVVEEATEDEFNSWPLPKESLERVGRVRARPEDNVELVQNVRRTIRRRGVGL